MWAALANAEESERPIPENISLDGLSAAALEYSAAFSTNAEVCAAPPEYPNPPPPLSRCAGQSMCGCEEVHARPDYIHPALMSRDAEHPHV